MKSKCSLMLITIFGMISCTSGNKTTNQESTISVVDSVKVEKIVSKVEPMVGVYVSSDYFRRAEGYDWVSVRIAEKSDTTVVISVRSRADKKKPTCTFDALAVWIEPNLLRSEFDGKGILFNHHNDTLTIAAEKSEESAILNYFCSGGATMAGDYILLKEPLDTTQIDKNVYSKVIKQDKHHFEVTQKGSDLSIIQHSAPNKPVLSQQISGMIVKSAELVDLNEDKNPELIILMASDDREEKAKVLAFTMLSDKSLQPITIRSISEDSNLTEGYKGGEKLLVVEGKMSLQFPVFAEDGKVTGKQRQVYYIMRNRQDQPHLVVDSVVEI